MRDLFEVPGVEGGRCAGIAVSGQQHGFVPMDDQGEVIRPAKLWCDTATVAEAEELSKQWGRHLPVGYTASKILWMKRHEPENFRLLYQVLLPHDCLNQECYGIPEGLRAATGGGDN